MKQLAEHPGGIHEYLETWVSGEERALSRGCQGTRVTQYFPFNKDFCREHGKSSGLPSAALNYVVIYWPL